MLTKRRICAALVMASIAALARPAFAHDSELGPNGGPMVEVKGLHLELIVKGADLAVVLSDAGHAPLASKGASGRAVILESSGQRTVQLTAIEPDRLTAMLDKPLTSGTRVVVSAKLATGQDLLARFVVK